MTTSLRCSQPIQYSTYCTPPQRPLQTSATLYLPQRATGPPAWTSMPATGRWRCWQSPWPRSARRTCSRRQAASAGCTRRIHSQWVESCEALSNSSHQCFWNPKSRITGEFCNTCDAVCYSEQKSFNFYQFTAGVMLICLSGALGFVSIFVHFFSLHTVEHQVSYFLCITVKEWNNYL